jgi:protein-S-isoprenylcysteine O-methyltransferase Ste14
MTPEMKLGAKVFARTLLVVAVVIGFFDRWFRPSYILLQEQPDPPPEWVGWLGWGLLAFAALMLLIIDFVEWRGSKK